MSKSAFQPDWLELREPVDHAARNAVLLEKAAGCVRPGKVVLDIGCGTGSSVRAFSKAGFPELQWRLFDNDPALLDIARSNHPAAETFLGNLVDLNNLPLENVGLVSCSALLDLMPENWVRSLAELLSKARIPFYGVFSYNGEMVWDPVDCDDAEVTLAFNRHQQTDKGLGSALGPQSGAVVARAFSDHGFSVATAESPWRLSQRNEALQTKLLEGIAEAAGEAGFSGSSEWLVRRLAKMRESTLVVGHTDVFAIPQNSGGGNDAVH